MDEQEIFRDPEYQEDIKFIIHNLTEDNTRLKDRIRVLSEELRIYKEDAERERILREQWAHQARLNLHASRTIAQVIQETGITPEFIQREGETVFNKSLN